MKIIKLNAIDSTNNYLKELARERDTEDLTVVLAHHQTSGRGQRGSSWSSTPGESLAFSIFKRFDGLGADRQFLISAVVSLAIVEALKDFELPEVAIKWPNDILSAKKKIGGILIENVLDQAFVKYSIIGIGLNVNQTELPYLPQAGSMKLQNRGEAFELEDIFQKLLSKIVDRLNNLSNKNFLEIKEDYENNLFRRNEISVFENPEGELFNGIIKGVSDIGELLVETEMEPLKKFQLKDVKLIY